MTHECQSTATPHHSTDMVEVWHGSPTPRYLCGYHYTYFLEA